MVKISFPISPRCSCCRYLVALKQGDDTILNCTITDKCPINMERNWAISGIKPTMPNNSPFIKKL